METKVPHRPFLPEIQTAEQTRITDEDEFEDLQGTKIAVQYAAAYLYEHREDADHHQLVLDLRSLLFGVRNPGF